MRVMNVILWGTCVALVVSYIIFEWHRRAHGWQHLNAPKSVSKIEGVDRDVIPGLPLRVYREAFILPWVVKDASWSMCNYQSMIGGKSGIWLYVIGVAGAVAILV